MHAARKAACRLALSWTVSEFFLLAVMQTSAKTGVVAPLLHLAASTLLHISMLLCDRSARCAWHIFQREELFWCLAQRFG